MPAESIFPMTRVTETNPPIRVMINALHSKSGGGVTYLNNIVPLLANDRHLELHIVLHASQLAQYEDLAKFGRLHIFDFNDGMVTTLLWEQFVLPLVVRMMDADIVYSPANYGPILVRRSVVLARNSLAVATKEARLAKIAYWAAVASMTMVSLWAARRAIAVSQYTVNSLTRPPFGWLRRKMTVINHGVSPAFQPGGGPRGNALLAVGDIYIQKNYHTLLEAFHRLRAHHPDLTLTIAGKPLDTKYAEILGETVTRLGLTESVTFLGHVTPDDLCRLYQTCRVFVFPSTVETFGNPLVEALACGTPTACSNRTAMPEIAGDAVEYFDPADVSSMCQAIERLLTDDDRRAHLSALALKRAADFSWVGCAAKLAEILKQAAR
jgi:glycosyltransferase involved in cell wall biosynthesis